MVEDGRKVKAKGKRKKAARLEYFLEPLSTQNFLYYTTTRKTYM